MGNVDLKTIAGVGVGVAIGHFAFKSKNALVLMAFGVGGGILSYHLLKGRGQKISEIDKQANNYAEQVKQDIEATLQKDTSESSSITGEEMAFNPKVGYITPRGTVKEENPAQYMDIGF